MPRCQLARQLGIPLDPAAIDWTQGGLRQLETIATRLCLEHHRRHSQNSTIHSACSLEPGGALACTSPPRSSHPPDPAAPDGIRSVSHAG